MDDVVLKRWTTSIVAPFHEPGLSIQGSLTFFTETDGQPRIELPRRDSFDPGAAVVEFEPTGIDLQRYLLARAATVTAETVDSSKPDLTATVRLQAIFDVVITIF